MSHCNPLLSFDTVKILEPLDENKKKTFPFFKVGKSEDILYTKVEDAVKEEGVEKKITLLPLANGSYNYVFKIEEHENYLIRITKPTITYDNINSEQKANEKQLESSSECKYINDCIQFGTLRKEGQLNYLTKNKKEKRELQYSIIEKVDFTLDKLDTTEYITYLELLPQFILHALKGLKCLQEKLNYVHLDIKPDNIGVKEIKKGEFVAYLFDFGFSDALGGPGVKNETNKRGEWCGTEDYIDPEFLKDRGEEKISHYFNDKSDVYSLGVTFRTILTNATINNQDLSENLLKKYNKIIDGMTKENYDKRFTIDKCIQEIQKIQEKILETSSDRYPSHDDLSSENSVFTLSTPSTTSTTSTTDDDSANNHSTTSTQQTQSMKSMNDMFLQLPQEPRRSPRLKKKIKDTPNSINSSGFFF